MAYLTATEFMGFSFKGFIYRIFIDPLINGLRRSIESRIIPGEKVIDIACGTGALSLAIARCASHVTGIDLSEDMITTARRMARKRHISNISFELLDATDLSCYPDTNFDLAVSSLAMHQFDPKTGEKVLREIKRLSRRIIIADYSCPMRPGPAAWLAYAIEYFAAGDHYRNFKKYMANGGLNTLAEKAGLTINSQVEKGQGVFIVALISSL